MRLLFVILIIQTILLQISCRQSTVSFPDLESYHGRAEDLLILEGPAIVPEAIERVKDRNTYKRPFIMAFLGNGAYKEAEPLMEDIVNDSTDPHRGVALLALFRIDPESGKKYASLYSQSEGDLGRIAHDILVNEPYLYARTSYSQAWLNYLSDTYF